MDDRPCFYCLTLGNHVKVCMSCRTKLEMDRNELARRKKDAVFSRNQHFRLIRENIRLREDVAKLMERLEKKP